MEAGFYVNFILRVEFYLARKHDEVLLSLANYYHLR